jgi:hypothetical protein
MEAEMTDNRDHTTDVPVGMQVWHDEPGPQPSPVPDERVMWFAFAFGLGLGALIMWMVMR